jgi:RimJ/RimL family protein N-acetyltransferase
VQLSEFIAYHRPALEQDEVRHNLILALLVRYLKGGQEDLKTWTLGEPGECAIKTAGRAIILGEVTETQCHRLAEETSGLDYPGVLGPDLTSAWFVERARELGHRFREPIQQQIHALRDSPKYPGAPGHARKVTGDDADLFVDWNLAFHQEAVPDDPALPRERLQSMAGEGRHWFWVVNGEPVSLAGIARRTRHAGAIAPVYTPPLHRGRGYAGSVTSAVVEHIFAEGKDVACLYTDTRNPYSNRCYTKIGFKPVCESRFFLRETP